MEEPPPEDIPHLRSEQFLEDTLDGSGSIGSYNTVDELRDLHEEIRLSDLKNGHVQLPEVQNPPWPTGLNSRVENLHDFGNPGFSGNQLEGQQGPRMDDRQIGMAFAESDIDNSKIFVDENMDGRIGDDMDGKKESGAFFGGGTPSPSSCMHASENVGLVGLACDIRRVGLENTTYSDTIMGHENSSSLDTIRNPIEAQPISVVTMEDAAQFDFLEAQRPTRSKPVTQLVQTPLLIGNNSHSPIQTTPATTKKSNPKPKLQPTTNPILLRLIGLSPEQKPTFPPCGPPSLSPNISTPNPNQKPTPISPQPGSKPLNPQTRFHLHLCKFFAGRLQVSPPRPVSLLPLLRRVRRTLSREEVPLPVWHRYPVHRMSP